ncbi:MAG: gluconolaconase [Planctomycetota bacterium]|nr:MAG: gluconolaconase [Planctomycetota bacterium]
MLLPLSLCLPAPHPGQVEADPGRLVVLNKAANTAMIFDLASGKRLVTLPTGNGPHEVAVSPDGRRAVVANYGRQQAGSSLTVLDLPCLEVVATLDLGKPIRPHGLVFTPDGESLWVTAEASQEVWRVSFPAGEVLDRFRTGQAATHMVALDNQGWAYSANIGSGSLSRVRPGFQPEVQSMATGAGAEGIAVRPDGRQVWVSNRQADTVSVVDLESWEVVKTLGCKGFPIRVLFTGGKALVTCPQDGALAFFDGQSGADLGRTSFAAKAADQGEGRLFRNQFGSSPVPIGMTANSAGTRVYVALAGADQVAIVNLDSQEVIGSLTTGKEPDGIAWYPSQPAQGLGTAAGD